MKRPFPAAQSSDASDLHHLIASNRYGTYFGVTQQIFDQVWNRLTQSDGNSVTYISMEIGADLDVFNPVKQRLQAMERVSSLDNRLKGFIKKVLSGPEKIPNYGGGPWRAGR